MKQFYAGFLLGLAVLAFASVMPKAEAINATLDNITVKDLFFGLMATGHYLKYGSPDFNAANKLANDMLQYRRGKYVQAD